MLMCLHVQRTEATIRGPNGQTFRVTKGAAHAVLGLVQTNKEIIASSVNKKVRTSAVLLHTAPLISTELPAH